MSDETWMEAIVSAGRPWTVSADSGPAIRKKSAWHVGPGWLMVANGDVVGLVMRRYGLVRADF